MLPYVIIILSKIYKSFKLFILHNITFHSWHNFPKKWTYMYVQHITMMSTQNYKKLEAQVSLYRSPDINKSS